MTTSEFLRVQLRLLAAQFGRKAIMESLASLTDATPEQLQEEIARFENVRHEKSRKPATSLAEIIASLPPIPEQVQQKVLKMGRLFESKIFLPNLRDAEEFLRRAGTTPKNFKKRKDMLGAVVKVLAEMRENDLESLVAQNADTGGKSDYSILADQLMGKKQ